MSVLRGGSVTPITVSGGGAARITRGLRANCAACYGGRGNSEAPTVVRIEAWGARSSTSTLGLGFAGLYNQRFDVGASKPRVAVERLRSHRARELTVRRAMEVEGIVKLRPLYASRRGVPGAAL
uniref:Uncharacterized protein n=1 Tax=Oryza nivara TaxID=4536 RepID=A0A0E0FG43_ORYNI